MLLLIGLSLLLVGVELSSQLLEGLPQLVVISVLVDPQYLVVVLLLGLLGQIDQIPDFVGQVQARIVVLRLFVVLFSSGIVLKLALAVTSLVVSLGVGLVEFDGLVELAEGLLVLLLLGQARAHVGVQHGHECHVVRVDLGGLVVQVVRLLKPVFFEDLGGLLLQLLGVPLVLDCGPIFSVVGV